jgi:hypothetical protein
MTEITDHPAAPHEMSELCSIRGDLCSVEHANRVAARVAEHGKSDTVVVRTDHPLQPFRVLLANCAGTRPVITRVLTCSDEPQSD